MKKIVFIGSIANSLEWYDFALYAHLASILGEKFFPQFDENASLLATLAVFGAGFIMRPFGAGLFGVIGDRYGRKTSLSLAILCMSIPTAMVGILPSYETIGIAAPIILCLLRLTQGLSLGGALIGSVSYIVEHAPKNKRGVAGSATMFSLCFGFMLGSFVAWLFTGLMGEENFRSYGWRFPFFLSLAAMFISYYLRKHADETPEFTEAKEQGKLTKKPIATLFKAYKHNFISSILINALGSVGFYVLAVYIGIYLENARGLSISDASIMESFVMMVVMISVVIGGTCSDKIGRKKWFTLTSILTAILIYPIIYFITSGNYYEIFTAQFIFAFLVGSWIGPEPSLQMALYPTNVRNTGVSLSYNIGCTLFGGLTPALCQYLYDKTDNINFIAIYIIIIALISLGAVRLAKRIA